MESGRVPSRGSLFLTGLGAMLFVGAAIHHARELRVLSTVDGPLLAFVLDSVPALGLAYAGHRLDDTDFSHDGQWRVCQWSVAGGVLFVGVIGATFLIRLSEGRTLTEPIFPLLIAAEAGALAGFTAGYYNTRARVNATRARTVTDALAFVNNLLRHDLSNDLNVIHGHATVLEANEDASGSPSTTDGAGIIVDETDEALARIESSRAIAKTLLGEHELERVDLAAITTEMAAHVHDVHGVPVRTDVPEHLAVSANAGLRSVVDNLLENAAEHNDADDPRVDVELSATSETARLVVRDNGPGIPDERKSTMFEPSEDAAGSGLSLVGTLVEEYDGEPTVEDNDPRGTVFVVELPLADAAL